MQKLILAALWGALFAATAAPLEIVSPKEGATVPILHTSRSRVRRAWRSSPIPPRESASQSSRIAR